MQTATLRARLRRLAPILVLSTLAMLALVRFRDGMDDVLDSSLAANAGAVAVGIVVAGVMLATLSRHQRR